MKQEQRRWGSFEVLNELEYDDLKVKIKKLIILPEKNISYQYHNNRGENWYILEGAGQLIIDDSLINVKAGDTFNIEKGQKHTIKADSKIILLEVQYGSVKPSEDDIVRIELEWNKILEIISNNK